MSSDAHIRLEVQNDDISTYPRLCPPDASTAPISTVVALSAAQPQDDPIEPAMLLHGIHGVASSRSSSGSRLFCGWTGVKVLHKCNYTKHSLVSVRRQPRRLTRTSRIERPFALSLGCTPLRHTWRMIALPQPVTSLGQAAGRRLGFGTGGSLADSSGSAAWPLTEVGGR